MYEKEKEFKKVVSPLMYISNNTILFSYIDKEIILNSYLSLIQKLKNSKSVVFCLNILDIYITVSRASACKQSYKSLDSMLHE